MRVGDASYVQRKVELRDLHLESERRVELDGVFEVFYGLVVALVHRVAGRLDVEVALQAHAVHRHARVEQLFQHLVDALLLVREVVVKVVVKSLASGSAA